MTYRTVVDIKITSNPTEEQSETLGEIIKSEKLSENLKQFAKKRYLEILNDFLQEESVSIDVQVKFLEED